MIGSMPSEICALRQGYELQILTVDCVDDFTGIGIICDVPSCCTFCRNSPR